MPQMRHPIATGPASPTILAGEPLNLAGIMPTTIPGQGMAGQGQGMHMASPGMQQMYAANAYPQATEIPPHSVHAQMLVVQSQQRRVDLSTARLALARELLAAERPTASVHFVLANAEQVPFAADSFEVIHGKAILHHLDLEMAVQEVKRLLLPGGKATFAEPMAQQPLFWLARRLTPKLRTRDEHPMQYAELLGFAEAFRVQGNEAFFLLAPLAYALRVLPGGEMAFRRLHGWFARLDAQLFRRLPALHSWAWYAMVEIEK